MDREIFSFRQEFPILENYFYLNSAGISPLPLRTKRAIEGLLLRYLQEGNIPWDDFEKISEEARRRVAEFIGAKPEEICFLRNTSEGVITVLNLLEFKPWENVIVATDNFPANFYPFLFSLPETEKRFVKILDGDILSQVEEKADERTKLISLDWVHFLSGYRIDLKGLSEFCAEKGIYLLIDAIQGLGALRLNLRELNISFLVAGGSKWLFPPQGIGILYINEQVLPELKSNHLGWLSCSWSDFNCCFAKKELKPSAAKYEEGTKNYLGIVGLNENVKMLQEFGIEKTERRVLELTENLISGLKEIGFEILPRGLGSGIVTFLKEGISSKKLYETLTKRRFVVSLREDRIRVSPHFYNTKEEIAELLKVLKGY